MTTAATAGEASCSAFTWSARSRNSVARNPSAASRPAMRSASTRPRPRPAIGLAKIRTSCTKIVVSRIAAGGYFVAWASRPSVSAHRLSRKRARARRPSHERQASVVLLLVRVRHQVDHDGAGEDQHVVLPLVDVDAVRVAQPEPLLAHPRNLPAAALEGVLVVEEVARSFEVVRAGNVDGELVAEEREQMLLHHRDRPPVADDLVLWAEAEELLVDDGQLVLVHVLERELVAEAEDLAVDVERVPAGLVLDGEVVAPREDSLAHHVSHGSVIAATANPDRLQVPPRL